MSPYFLAVDIGASSGRHMLGLSLIHIWTAFVVFVAALVLKSLKVISIDPNFVGYAMIAIAEMCIRDRMEKHLNRYKVDEKALREQYPQYFQ